MLKKLFISLLILSALTSEGVMVFPGSFVNVYAGLSAVTGVLGEAGASVEQPEVDMKGCTVSGTAFSNNAFLLTDASIQKLKYKNRIQGFYENAGYTYQPVIYHVSRPVPFLGEGRENVLTRSGLSPPYREI